MAPEGLTEEADLHDIDVQGCWNVAQSLQQKGCAIQDAKLLTDRQDFLHRALLFSCIPQQALHHRTRDEQMCSGLF